MPTERMVARGASTARATISEEPPPFDPYAAEATAVLVAKSALSAAKDELRSVEHRTQALLAPPDEPFKAGAATPAKAGAKAPPVDEAQEALVQEAQAAVAEAKLHVQACKAEHAAAEGTLRRRRLVQLAEKLEVETKAQKGFVAAQLDSDIFNPNVKLSMTCEHFDQIAQEIFRYDGPSDTSSTALSVLCRRAKADHSHAATKDRHRRYEPRTGKEEKKDVPTSHKLCTRLNR